MPSRLPALRKTAASAAWKRKAVPYANILQDGGRTNWHTHAVGQVLYVLTGVGRYQLEGEAPQVLLPGDTVIIPPGARHWHGGAPDHMMTHLAMSETDDKAAATTWLEPVSDADYTKAPA